jgi:hypothetical protein
MPCPCDQEDPVHDALQVRRRGHSYVGGALFDKTCEKAQQKQEHSVIVRADLALFYRVWFGHVDYDAAMRCGDLVVDGLPACPSCGSHDTVKIATGVGPHAELLACLQCKWTWTSGALPPDPNSPNPDHSPDSGQ